MRNPISKADWEKVKGSPDGGADSFPGFFRQPSE